MPGVADGMPHEHAVEDDEDAREREGEHGGEDVAQVGAQGRKVDERGAHGRFL